jgi:pimeloyl-ACP methyl ester carboxylesterase
MDIPLREVALPVSAARAEHFMAVAGDGANIACYAWRGPAATGAPCVLWGHANGFNAGCYAPFLDMLAERFQVFAFDARGHGGSDKPEGDFSQVYAMDRFAADLGAVAVALRARIGGRMPLHYAAHSLGGIAAVLLEGRFGQVPFETLTLFEPPIYPPEGHEARQRASESSPLFVNWAARRREVYPDRAALRAEASAIATFTRFAPEMLEAYVAAVAGEQADGSVRLFCPGAVESAIYANCPPAGVFEATAGVMTPTWIYSSDPEAVDSGHIWTPPTIRDVAANMGAAVYKTIPGGRHLMVQEFPRACADEIIAHVTGAAD